MRFALPSLDTLVTLSGDSSDISRHLHYPAADLRALAQHLFRHFEGKVAAGGLGAAGLVREAELPEYRGLYASAARDLPNPPEDGRLEARVEEVARAGRAVRREGAGVDRPAGGGGAPATLLRVQVRPLVESFEA